jgi:hypothetical protein
MNQPVARTRSVPAETFRGIALLKNVTSRVLRFGVTVALYLATSLRAGRPRPGYVSGEDHDEGYRVVQLREVLDWFQRYIRVDDRYGSGGGAGGSVPAIGAKRTGVNATPSNINAGLRFYILEVIARTFPSGDAVFAWTSAQNRIVRASYCFDCIAAEGVSIFLVSDGGVFPKPGSSL